MNNFSYSLLFTLKEEGGFSNDPHDPGGATMKGITLSEYQKYFNKPNATAKDLRRITDEEISNIYMNEYWKKVRAEELPSGVDLSVFDMGVNAGPNRSIKILQTSLNILRGNIITRSIRPIIDYIQSITMPMYPVLKVDGVLGPQTIHAVYIQLPINLITQLKTDQTKFYKSLSNYQYFGKGWINRANRREMTSLGLIPPLPTLTMAKAE